MSLTEVRQQAMQMPLADRAALAHDLLTSLDPGDPTFTQDQIDAAQTTEAHRRLDDFERTPVPTRNAADSLRDVRKEFLK